MLLDTFQEKVGSLPEFQAIICDEPSPRFLIDVFEYGVEQFISFDGWAAETAELLKSSVSVLADTDSSESKTIAMQQNINRADKSKIQALDKDLEEVARFDYRVAFIRGKAAEAQGNYEKAAEAFKVAKSMNEMYRPSSNRLSESLLVTGQVDEAISVLENLERSNKRYALRKATLSTAYMVKGDLHKAEELLKEATSLFPNHSKVKEAQAQLLLRQ